MRSQQTQGVQSLSVLWYLQVACKEEVLNFNVMFAVAVNGKPAQEPGIAVVTGCRISEMESITLIFDAIITATAAAFASEGLQNEK